MSVLDDLKRDLVRANRILANEGIVDAWGHISFRNPENPDTWTPPFTSRILPGCDSLRRFGSRRY